MQISEHINALRAAIPGCSLAAFGDADARLLLRASHDRKLHREHLDRLCEEAADCFDLAREVNAGRGAARRRTGPEEVIVMTPVDVKIFVKSDRNEADFMCLVCDTSCDARSVVEMARSSLNRIADPQ